MLLSISGLSCRRGETIVLTDVSVTLAAGDALVLRGPNGAGKTTLLRTLAGLTPPVSGAVDAEACAYAAHADGLKTQLTVAQNLGFWARLHGARDIAHAVAAFDLAPLLDRRAADLSAGQKRRAGLARMLLTGRPVWLLDEPTVSLDAENTARLARVVSDHLAAGGASILATHIDLGLRGARTLDVTRFAPTGRPLPGNPFAEAVE